LSVQLAGKCFGHGVNIMSKCVTVAVVTLAVPYEEFEEGLPTGDQPAGLRLSHVMKWDHMNERVLITGITRAAIAQLAPVRQIEFYRGGSPLHQRMG
jgi:hypothetical protein